MPDKVKFSGVTLVCPVLGKSIENGKKLSFLCILENLPWNFAWNEPKWNLCYAILLIKPISVEINVKVNVMLLWPKAFLTNEVLGFIY